MIGYSEKLQKDWYFRTGSDGESVVICEECDNTMDITDQGYVKALEARIAMLDPDCNLFPGV